MEDKKIIEEVCEKLKLSEMDYKYFHDGTDSRVMLLNNQYLVKINEPRSIKADNEYLNINSHPLLQRLIYSGDNYHYAVYDFMHGDVMRNLDGYDTRLLVNQIFDLINSYPVYESDLFGYLDAPVDSFRKFLTEEVNYNRELVTFELDYDLIDQIIDRLDKYPFVKKLLHGDLGTHNLIGNGKSLVGVIDPQPVIGDPLYELMAFITSNPGIINNFTVNDILDLQLGESNHVLDMLLVATYIRIGRCLKYHPSDIEDYLVFLQTVLEQYNFQNGG